MGIHDVVRIIIHFRKNPSEFIIDPGSSGILRTFEPVEGLLQIEFHSVGILVCPGDADHSILIPALSKRKERIEEIVPILGIHDIVRIIEKSRKNTLILRITPNFPLRNDSRIPLEGFLIIFANPAPIFVCTGYPYHGMGIPSDCVIENEVKCSFYAFIVAITLIEISTEILWIPNEYIETQQILGKEIQTVLIKNCIRKPAEVIGNRILHSLRFY